MSTQDPLQTLIDEINERLSASGSAARVTPHVDVDETGVAGRLITEDFPDGKLVTQTVLEVCEEFKYGIERLTDEDAPGTPYQRHVYKVWWLPR